MTDDILRVRCQKTSLTINPLSLRVSLRSIYPFFFLLRGKCLSYVITIQVYKVKRLTVIPTDVKDLNCTIDKRNDVNHDI